MQKSQKRERVVKRHWVGSSLSLGVGLVLLVGLMHLICQEQVGVSQESKPSFIYCETEGQATQTTSKTMTYFQGAIREQGGRQVQKKP